MADTYGNQFLSGYEVPTVATSAYLVPDNVLSIVVGNAAVRNYGSSEAKFTLWMLPSGATLDDNYKAIIEKTIGVGESVPLSIILSEPLNTGGQIYVQSNVVDTLSLTIGGTIRT